jgi:hypothetical protein
VILALSFGFGPDTLPELQTCAFRRITGRPCFGCGMTRAFCAISHGEFSRAFRLHPFAYPLYAACVALLIAPISTRLRWRPRFDRHRAAKVVRWGLWILALGWLAFGLWRIRSGKV